MKRLCDQSLPQMGGPFPPNKVGRIAQHVRKGEVRKGRRGFELNSWLSLWKPQCWPRVLFYICSLEFLRSVAICRHESGRWGSVLLFNLFFLSAKAKAEDMCLYSIVRVHHSKVRFTFQSSCTPSIAKGNPNFYSVLSLAAGGFSVLITCHFKNWLDDLPPL